ncbi:chromatin remodeling protein EBS-like isoform X2 [Gastrolobium bilobum]|uniref:chromatin remodeling protein EBS-like isoform X2 n=1 Tax=Gastrolobium bilobum TaxID=150636 RepID=UPI002AB2F626|nr:chromatin remodeling protein EBS-like isoform X2 [Gastrolobium bilobum]
MVRGRRERDMDSFTISGTDKIVKVGDCVLLRPSEDSNSPYVALVDSIWDDNRNNVNVKSAHTIEGKCVVHSFKDYTRLENVGAEDYYCRFEYAAATGAFTPDRVAVYCNCEMPYNPDDLMMQCEECTDWYHPACVGMTTEESKKLELFICVECLTYAAMKKPQATSSASPGPDVKAERKRRERRP